MKRLVGRNGLVHGFAAATPVVRLLVLTQLAFNVGFFMVLPYLSVHLSSDLGQATAVVGAVLGLRTISQQGLFFLGGAIADRIGTRPTVLAGCAVRVAGFTSLALSTSLVGIIIGTSLTGFAGALFSPAVEAALARASASPVGDRTKRIDAFALFQSFGQIGAFTGPMIGALLLAANFTIVALTGAAIFVLIGLAHLRWLPTDDTDHAPSTMRSGWADVFQNRQFLLFAAVMSVQLVAYNQLYLLLPLELESGWGSQAPLGFLMAASSAAVVLCQIRIASWTTTRRPAQTIRIGFAITAIGLALAAGGAAIGQPAAVLAGTTAFVLLMAVGQMIIGPTARAMIPVLAGERHLGLYYGVYASAGGILVLPTASALGALIDVVPDTALGRAIPWLAMAALVTLAALAARQPTQR